MAAYYNEIEPFAAQALRNMIEAGLIPAGHVDERSILDIKPRDLDGYAHVHFFAGIGIWALALRRIGWPDDQPIWSGSCPCQPFSTAGRGFGFADERHLWPAWYHLITQCRPPVVVGEQVASKDGLGWFDLVSTDLENAAYAVGAADLCAAGFSEEGRDGGGFHLRQRNYFVATRDELGDASGERRGKKKKGGDEYRRDGQAERDCRAGHGDGLANADRRERSGLADGEGRKRNGQATGRLKGDSQFEPSSDLCGLADDDDTGLERRGGMPECSSQCAAREGSLVSRVANRAPDGRRKEPAVLGGLACRDYPKGWPARFGRGGGGDFDRHNDDTGRPNANLVYCRDGPWRPVEPGAFPLAYAVPRSLGKMPPGLRELCDMADFGKSGLKAARDYRRGALKAFGNALDFETVTAFLDAALN